MKPVTLPSRAELLARYVYNPNTGEITHRDSGKPALSYERSDTGYLTGDCCGVTRRAHRVAWKMYYGTDPEVIDHINGNRTDNRIANLRSGTLSENQRNVPRRKDNKSGATGVCWNSSKNLWRARIYVDGKPVNLGLFKDLSAAAAVRKAAEKQYGFSARHGQ